MIAFSQRLAETLQRKQWTQAQLAKLCGVNPSTVSRWSKGKGWPDRHALLKLAEVLPEEESTDLLAAWVRDLMPKDSKAMVSILPSAAKVQSLKEDGASLDKWKADTWPDELNAQSRRMFVDFSRLAVHNPDIMEVVKVLHKAAMREQKK